MTGKRAKIRLYVDADLGPTQSVPLSRDQAHYLFVVMRLGEGDTVALFNGRDGEWTAVVADRAKHGGALLCQRQAALLHALADVWLLFAPVKKARTDLIVEKAAEMGVARICPVLTQFTNSERVRRARLQAHATEATEQCGGTIVPDIAEAMRLTQVLDTWPKERRLLFFDERLVGSPTALKPNAANEKWAVLIGPEGGFSAPERARLQAMAQTTAASLGPRILRADTAVVAALTLWQTSFGDWR